MKKTVLFLVCLVLVLSYQTDGNVLKLGESDFDAALNQHNNVLVKFFAPWCGHCKNLAPAYKEAADALKQAGSTVRLAEVDCTIHKALCQKYEIKGYPTVNYFAKGQQKPQKYSSSRTKQAIVAWLNQRVPGEKKENQQEKGQQKVEQQNNKPEFDMQGALYKLTKQTFGKAQQKFDFLFVKFFAPWCGHCKKMAETWLQFADSNKNQKVGIAEVDCTQHAALCGQNGVQGYPTVKFFARGIEAIKYQKARTIQAFTEFLQQQISKVIPVAAQDIAKEPEVKPQEL